MEHRYLGNSGLKVSEIIYGNWLTHASQVNDDQAIKTVHAALDGGITTFDTADVYANLAAEKVMGDALKGQRREGLEILTKVYWPVAEKGPNDVGLSRKHIMESINGSLQRLQTDYVDLYQVHWPERATNFFGVRGYVHYPSADGIAIEETLDALSELVDEGLVKHVGISNEAPWGLMEYLRLASERGLAKVVSIQNVYNLLSRQFESGLAEMAIREQVGLLAYSPMAFGVLSGKYIGGQKPAGSRLELFERFARYGSVQTEAATEAYMAIADKHGMTLAQMSLAFVCQQPFVTSCLIGATNMQQLEENIAAVEVVLSKEVLAEIEAIHNQYPDPAP